MKSARFILRRRRAVILEMEIEGKFQRASFPAESIALSNEDIVYMTEEEFSLGIPFGIPFEDRLSGKFLSPISIAEALHNVGLWTSKDIQENPRLVQSALVSLLGDTLHEITSLAREFKAKE